MTNENKTKVIFLLHFDPYKTDNFFKGTKFVMEQGGDLGVHMTVSFDKNVDKFLRSEIKQVLDLSNNNKQSLGEKNFQKKKYI